MALRIDEITAVDLEILHDDPLILRVAAHGRSRQTGWRDPCLIARDYYSVPADGYWDFDFLAYPPTWPGPPVGEEISASARWGDAELGRLRGIRVHGARSSLEVDLSRAAKRFRANKPGA